MQFENGRDAVSELCPSFTDCMYQILRLEKENPIAVENCIEIISRACASPGLQEKFVDAGVVWYLMPMLLAFDDTLNAADYNDESQRSIHNQTSANMHAILAAKALGRLGGYMHEDLSSQEQPEVRQEDM